MIYKNKAQYKQITAQEIQLQYAVNVSVERWK